MTTKKIQFTPTPKNCGYKSIDIFNFFSKRRKGHGHPKTLVWGVAILFFGLLLSVGLLLLPHHALAQPAPTQPAPSSSNSGLSLATALGGPGLAASSIVIAVLWALKGILIVFVAFAGYLLNVVFNFNLVSPAGIQSVQLGWVILRDISNSVFILIILWIAFTIIFDFESESLGGRKLLIKVVVMALLINFSLVLVTGLFGITNFISQQFADRMPPDVAAFIAGTINLQNVDTQLSPAQSQQLQQQYQQTQVQQDANTQRSELLKSEVQGPSVKDTLLASVGIQSAQAQAGTIGGAVAGCIAASLFTFGIGCPAAALAGGFIGAITDVLGSSLIGTQLNIALRLAAADIFLLLAFAALGVGAVALLVRFLAMIILSIFAPVAFILYALPGKFGHSYFQMWLSALIKWAFFAPIFYFLFYIALFILDKGTSSQLNGIDPSINPEKATILLISLGFMVTAVWFAKKSGGVVADTAMNFGKGAAVLGLGAATSGLALGVAALARRAGPGVIEPALDRIDRAPGFGGSMLRTVTAPMTRRVTNYMEEQKDKIGESKKKFKGSDTHVLQEYNRSLKAEDVVAGATTLAERGKFNMLPPEEQTRAIRLAQQFSPDAVLALLKMRPDLATPQHFAASKIADKIREIQQAEQRTPTEQEAALLLVADKIKPDDLAKMSDETFQVPVRMAQETDDVFRQRTDRRNQMLRGLYKSFSPEHFRRTMRENPSLARNLTDTFTEQPHLITTLRPETYEYLNNNIGRSIFPVEHTPPPQIQEEQDEATREQAARQAQRETQEAARQAQRDAQEATRRQQRQVEEAARQAQREIQNLQNDIQRRRANLDQLTARQQGLTTSVGTPGLDERTRTRLQADLNGLTTQIQTLENQIQQVEEELRRRQANP